MPRCEWLALLGAKVLPRSVQRSCPARCEWLSTARCKGLSTALCEWLASLYARGSNRAIREVSIERYEGLESLYLMVLDRAFGTIPLERVALSTPLCSGVAIRSGFDHPICSDQGVRSEQALTYRFGRGEAITLLRVKISSFR